MDIRFDSCIEGLLEYLGSEKPELKPVTDALAAMLPDFRNDCLKERICPVGELMRGWAVRNMLRDAVKRMEGRLTAMEEDASIQTIMFKTKAYIEHVGDESEAERAYIVARNLLIISENIAGQIKKQKFPALGKQPLKLECMTVSQKGLDVFLSYMEVTRVQDLKQLLKGNSKCDFRYRQMLFNLLIDLVIIRDL